MFSYPKWPINRENKNSSNNDKRAYSSLLRMEESLILDKDMTLKGSIKGWKDQNQRARYDIKASTLVNIFFCY